MTASIDVLHVKETYLQKSEKWFHYILNLNSHGRKWLACRFTNNLEEFPLGKTELIQVCPENLLSRIVNRGTLRFIDRPVFWGTSAYAAAVKSVQPSVVHAHYGPMGYVLSRDETIPGPFVTSFYGYDISMLPRNPFWKDAYARLFERGAGFIVEGSHMKQTLIDLGCEPKKAFIVRIPVNPDELPVKSYTESAGRKKVILMCCNFVEKKGIPWALHAFALAHDRIPDTELRIIGSGELRQAVIDLIRELNLTDAVALLGPQPHSVFIEEAMKADLFMQPSIVARDGTTEGGAPTVLIEAQCMGLPVVSSFHADIPEIVRDGQSGHLVPEGDIESLAGALCRLLEEPRYWPEMGRHGREHAIQQHAPCAVARQLHEVYASVLKGT
jgi:colanic acid/amylovoran biosynthesis glycosyltransferase